jgi:hypothetical protein
MSIAKTTIRLQLAGFAVAVATGSTGLLAANTPASAQAAAPFFARSLTDDGQFVRAACRRVRTNCEPISWPHGRGQHCDGYRVDCSPTAEERLRTPASTVGRGSAFEQKLPRPASTVGHGSPPEVNPKR